MAEYVLETLTMIYSQKASVSITTNKRYRSNKIIIRSTICCSESKCTFPSVLVIVISQLFKLLLIMKEMNNAIVHWHWESRTELLNKTEHMKCLVISLPTGRKLHILINAFQTQIKLNKWRIRCLVVWSLNDNAFQRDFNTVNVFCFLT